MTSILKVEGLSVLYRTDQKEVLALDAVNLEVGPGEILSLMGETGCGKSTLVRAVLGTLQQQARITNGRVWLNGIDMLNRGDATRRARGRDITYVPQDPYSSLNPLFRIGTQIADLMRYAAPERTRRSLFARWGGYEAAILSMLEAVQIMRGHEILHQYPHQLSGGMRQRVMLAMALLPRPRIVVADEPTASLDTMTQAHILRLFREVARERNVAILFTTHHLGAAWEISDRIAVMQGGRIVETATREAFFERAEHPYSRQLLDITVNKPRIEGRT